MAIEAIIDSSVFVALVTPEKYSDWVSQKIQKYEYCHVCDLSFYEVANAIKYKISDSLNERDALAAFKKAQKIMNLCAVHNFSEIIADAFTTAAGLKITVYDAAFLTLAEKLKMPLLTLDVKLANGLKQTKYDKLIERPAVSW